MSGSSTSDNMIMNLIGSTAVPLNDNGFVIKDNGSASLKFGLKVDGDVDVRYSQLLLQYNLPHRCKIYSVNKKNMYCLLIPVSFPNPLQR